MRLQFTHSATRDLTRLRAFIAEKDPQAATRVSRRLGRTIRHLRDHPELGRPLEELPEVRELVAGDYIVRYTLGDESVTILRIWHGREAR
ncbi:MAG: type II toxin-antitoxin system RelE/ParE family toxin [Pseudomonadota bacterium]|nr:type II toxin-antitoxin system RelE/ParE family toxin [Pseudomonadota bacterium]